MLASQTVHQVEISLGSKVLNTVALTGACIAQSYKLTLADGRVLFVKTACPQEILEAEALGISEIAKQKVLRTPKILCKDKHFLAFEFIESKAGDHTSFENFALQLAQLHQVSQSQFGFESDNFIGRSPQPNTAFDAWHDFYWQNRLLFQIEMALEQGYQSLLKPALSLEKRILKILDGSYEAPALIHGDLWYGNFLIDRQGQALVFDPAVYYGHREAELAMTQLFGGFPQSFYDAYQHHFPLADGAAYRRDFYQLYHLLNHLNLFGDAYLLQCMSIMSFYTR